MDASSALAKKRHRSDDDPVQRRARHVRDLIRDDGDDSDTSTVPSTLSHRVPDVLRDTDALRDPDARDADAGGAHPSAERLLLNLYEAPTNTTSMTLSELTAVFSLFRRKWIPTDMDPRLSVEHAANRFGDTSVDGQGHCLSDLVFTPRLETHQLDIAYKKELWVWAQLQYHFRTQNLLDIGGGRTGDDDDLGLNSSSTADFATDFSAIKKTIISSYDILKQHLNYMKINNPTIDSGAPPALDPPNDHEKSTAFHDLTLFVLDELMAHGFRKFRGGCWRPILSDPLPTGEVHEDGTPILRRVPTHAWEPVMRGGRSVDLEQFIVSVVRKEDHFKHWSTMTTGGNFQNLVTFLRDRSDELEFQSLTPNRDFISFKNGLLDIRGLEAEGPRFFPFPITSPLRVPHVVSNNFIAGHFGVRGCSGKGLCNGWPSLQDVFLCGSKRLPTDPLPSTHPDMYKSKQDRDLAPDTVDWTSVWEILNSDAFGAAWLTPTFNGIFFLQLKPEEMDEDGKVIAEAHTLFWTQCFNEIVKSQARRNPSLSRSRKDVPPDVLELMQRREFAHMVVWHYALLGRLLFRVNDKDSWQVIQMIKGVAGCGKSTILNLVGKFFRPEDVETLSNQTRGGGRAIGVLETVYDKFLWRVYEIKQNFGLDQSAFQSMVSGEIVPIDRLHQKTISVAWTVPGILAGNEFGGWRDNSGSILRRVLVSNFAHIIDEKTKDPLMPAKLDMELPAILHKCLLAYCLLTSLYKGSDVWQVVPEYFRWTRSKLSAASDPLASFLASTPAFLKDASAFVPLSSLIASFKEWATEEGLSRTQMQSVTSLDEDKLKPSLAQQGLEYVRVTAANRRDVEAGLHAPFEIPADWNKGKGFVVVRGLRKVDDK